MAEDIILQLLEEHQTRRLFEFRRAELNGGLDPATYYRLERTGITDLRRRIRDALGGDGNGEKKES